MKKSIYLIFTFCLLAGIWQACDKKEELITTGGIYGTVLDKTTGEPIRNAEITLSPSSKTTVVGSNGTFEFVNIEAGQYTVGVEADGYEYNSKTVTVIAGENTACDFHLETVVVEQKLEITPTSLNFGTTQNQLSVTITNKGTKETAWSLNLGNNTWLSASPKSDNIAAGKKQTIVFSVNRSLITKDESAIISIAAFGNSYSLTISCEAKKGKLEVTPTVLNFGEDSNEQTFTIKNIGNANMNWSVKGLSATCLSLSEMGGTLPEGASKVLKLTLDRTALSGDLSTSFTITDELTEQEIQVSATKKVLQSVLNVTPTILNFGEDSNEQTFTIKNIGNANMNWSVKGLSATCLSLSEMGGTLPEGASKVLKLTLDRTALSGDLSTSFTITDGLTEQEIQVYAQEKVLRPIMNISPAILDFEDNSTSETFTISNSGNADLNWSLTDANSEMLSFSAYSGTVSPGGKNTVTVTLDRTAMHTDLNLSIGVSDGSSTQSVTIKATYVYVEDYSSAIVESFDNRLKCDIISCKRNGSKVEFKFKLTNTGFGDISDFSLLGSYGSYTIIYDNLGNQYEYQSMSLGNKSDSGYGSIRVPLLEYVGCNGSISIANVPTNAETLTIKLCVSGYDSSKGHLFTYEHISIKNLPIY